MSKKKADSKHSGSTLQELLRNFKILEEDTEIIEDDEDAPVGTLVENVPFDENDNAEFEEIQQQIAAVTQESEDVEAVEEPVPEMATEDTNHYSVNENGFTVVTDAEGNNRYYDENGNEAYFDEEGSQYFIDENGYAFYYDEEGNVFYKDEEGNAFYIDENGESHYYEDPNAVEAPIEPAVEPVEEVAPIEPAVEEPVPVPAPAPVEEETEEVEEPVLDENEEVEEPVLDETEEEEPQEEVEEPAVEEPAPVVAPAPAPAPAAPQPTIEKIVFMPAPPPAAPEKSREERAKEKYPQLAQIPVLLDMIMQQNVSKKVKIQVASMVLKMYEKYKGDPDGKFYVLQCMSKVMAILSLK